MELCHCTQLGTNNMVQNSRPELKCSVLVPNFEWNTGTTTKKKKVCMENHNVFEGCLSVVDIRSMVCLVCQQD